MILGQVGDWNLAADLRQRGLLGSLMPSCIMVANPSIDLKLYLWQAYLNSQLSLRGSQSVFPFVRIFFLNPFLYEFLHSGTDFFF